MSMRQSRPHLPRLIGSSEAFRAFLERLTQAARSDATLLIVGESGTGKNAAAHAAHAVSSRADGPLVTVSLPALAPTLVEAELFGHEEGAFTGAAKARPGRFRQAHGGTLVLDDVGSLALASQVKLLRVLQERKVEPVGSDEAVAIDVRVIATSSRELAGEVEAGRFRADLHWRLAVVTLEVPPLRLRKSDLPELADHLVAALAARHGLAQRPLSPAALAHLESHSWPGNVRELENLLERALVLAPDRVGRPLEPEELQFLESAPAELADALAQQALSQGLTLADLEEALLRAAMREHRGNLSAAARAVGLTRRALEYRLGHPRAREEEPRG